MYLVDVLHYFLLYPDVVDEVRAHFRRPPIPQTLQSLYWIFLPLQLFSLSVEARSRKLYEIIPLVTEVVREFRDVAERLGSTPEKAIFEFVTAHFFARLRIKALEPAVTAWMMSYQGRQSLRDKEKRFHAPGLSEPPDLSKVRCVSEMTTQWSNKVESGRVSAPAPVISPEAPEFDPPDIVTPELFDEDPPLALQTPVSRQRKLFDRALHDERQKMLDIQLTDLMLPNLFQVALKEMRSKADQLQLNADEVEATFRSWMFDSKVPTVPLEAAENWREVHLWPQEWHGLSKIGLRYASIGTSEDPVERLLSEQEDVQGAHGVNFGTETLHSRLCTRHAAYLKSVHETECQHSLPASISASLFRVFDNANFAFLSRAVKKVRERGTTVVDRCLRTLLANAKQLIQSGVYQVLPNNAVRPWCSQVFTP
jgi:hypothetical protein